MLLHHQEVRSRPSQNSKSIFSFLLGPLSHSLYGKWGFCCPFNAIIGAVQSSALRAEASALHWVSGHTLQSKCGVSPPSAVTPPLLFTTAVQPSTLREKQEPENKHKTWTENETKEGLVNRVILLCLFFFFQSTYVSFTEMEAALLSSNIFVPFDQIFFVLLCSEHLYDTTELALKTTFYLTFS